MPLQLSHFFFPCIPLCSVTPPTIIPPPEFKAMGHIYKFFGFSISHTILILPWSILYLPFIPLIPCTFIPILRPSPHPSDNPPCALYFCESVPVRVVCLDSFRFCFCFCLGLVVDSCEFVVTLLFVFFIFFFFSHKSL